MKNIYTDLALEERERFERNVEIKGVEIKNNYDKDIHMNTTVVDIVNEQGAKSMGKPVGSYITMESRVLKAPEETERRSIASKLAEHLLEVIQKDHVKSELIVGLGNMQATPDALGPRTVKEVLPSEKVYCIAPGVLAQTGMETFDIVKGIVGEVNPDIVIAVDSLAARNVRRITTTIQITDTGIHPGSGVGNHRNGLTEDNLQVKVIGIGVPTVVDAATIVHDSMAHLLDALEEQEQKEFLEEMIAPNLYSMFVTPKDVDETVKYLSFTISEGLNMAFSGV